MKMIYSPKGLWHYACHSLLLLASGIVRLPWLVLLVIVNLVAGFARKIAECARRWPVRTLLATIATMGLLTFVVFADMKAKLTTAEWQRDSLRMKVDSAKAWHAGHVVKYTEYLGELDK